MAESPDSPAPPGRTTIGGLVAERKAVVMPGVYDALSALVAEKAGFELAFISGYSASASHLGLPDMGYLNQSDISDIARRVCGAVSMPVIVDADTGYGNPLNVRKTVRDLIRAGAKGCFIEDQEWPKRCGHMRGKRIIDRPEYAEKIAAAAEEKGGRDFFVVARTDAVAVSGLDEALARMADAKEAGADGFFVEAPRDRAQMEAICSGAPRPLVANMIEGGATPILPKDELAAIGYSLILYPLSGLYTAADALRRVYADLMRTGTTDGKGMTSFDEFNEIIGADSHLAMSDRHRTP